MTTENNTKYDKKPVIYDNNGYPIDSDFEMDSNVTIKEGFVDDNSRKLSPNPNVASYTNILKQKKNVLQIEERIRKERENYFKICSVRLPYDALIYLNEKSSKPSVYIRNLVMDDMAKNSKPIEDQYKKEDDLE